ncbi:MAG: cation:proton antiporter [Deltaproteobacteria bacterium]|nr:cation:proton antiporter [Deltaproteobacteria bacterium]
MLVSPSPGFGAAVVASKAHPLLHVLIALVVIIVCGRVVGALFRRIGQPPVIGEVISGIMLGPSLLGRVWPEAYAFVLPAAMAPMLGILSQIGVILYMFIVGLSLDMRTLRGREHTTVAISHASIVLPFTLGAVLALFLYPRVATNDVPFTVFALFVAVSMSVTAFPVLARILTDRRVHKTRMGVIALTCAAADDVSAWCLLAFVVGIARADVGSAFVTIGLAVGYAVLVVFALRPWLDRKLQRAEANGEGHGRFVPLAFVGLLCSALATEAIGVHAIFGAFLFGAIIPSDSALAKSLVQKLEDVVTIVFLPAFFAFTGMRTQIGLVDGQGAWLMCALIVLVASAGKFLGSTVAARVTGLSWRDASALGILMNTRGLMELIVLNIGYDLKILSPVLFAMLVIMAVVTTVATSPILHLITRRAPWSEESVSSGGRSLV